MPMSRGFTKRDCDLFQAVSKDAPRTMKQIADLAGVDKQAVRQSLLKLVEHGLLSKNDATLPLTFLRTPGGPSDAIMAEAIRTYEAISRPVVRRRKPTERARAFG